MSLWIHFKFKLYIILNFFLFCILFLPACWFIYVYTDISKGVYWSCVQLLFVPKRERMWKATTVLLASSCLSSNCMRFILHADAYMFHANNKKKNTYTHFLEQYYKRDKNMKMLLSKRSVVFCLKVKYIKWILRWPNWC